MACEINHVFLVSVFLLSRDVTQPQIEICVTCGSYLPSNASWGGAPLGLASEAALHGCASWLTTNMPKAIRDGMRGISFVLLLTVIIPAPWLAAQTPAPSSTPPESISFQVDATEVARKLLHSRLSIPVTPGPLTLYYPKWIPGEHAPTGPIDRRNPDAQFGSSL